MLEILFVVICVVLFLRFHYNRNRYIIEHQDHLKNDKHYDDYLRWCLKNDHVPMDKKSFNKEIEDRNKKFSDLIK